MSWDEITTAQIQVGKPGNQGLMQKIKDNLDYLYGIIGTLESGSKNGSFEIYSIVGGVPVFNSWDISLYAGGSYGVGTTGTEIAHGAAALKLTHPGGVGNGGGYADSDYVPCSSSLAEDLGFIHWSSNPATKNQVYVRYYDKDKVYFSEAQIYSSTSNPATAKLFQYQHTPPASAYFYKIRIIGGYTDTNQPGTAFFDGMFTEKSKPVLDYRIRTVIEYFPFGGTTTAGDFGANRFRWGGHGGRVPTIGYSTGANGETRWDESAGLVPSQGDGLYLPAIDYSKNFVSIQRVAIRALNVASYALIGHGIILTQNCVSSPPDDMIYFCCNGTNNWLAKTRSGGVETSTDTGVGHTAGVLQDFKIVRYQNNVLFYIDGTLVAIHTTNIPTSVSDYRLVVMLEGGAVDPGNTFYSYAGFKQLL